MARLCVDTNRTLNDLNGQIKRIESGNRGGLSMLVWRLPVTTPLPAYQNTQLPGSEEPAAPEQ